MAGDLSAGSGMDHFAIARKLVRSPEAKAYRLVIHVMSDGQLLLSVFHRTWRGRETWDRRLTPSRPLAAPPAPPHGLSPFVWVIWSAAQALVRQHGFDCEIWRGAPPASPNGGPQGGRSTDTPTDE